LWDQAEESGVTPQALLTKPEIPPQIVWVWVAFSDLNTTRPMGMSGLGMISWLSVWEYSKAKRLDADDFELLWTCIQAMDKVFLEWQEKESQKSSRTKK
jgi:hypothetical protein